MMKRAAFIAAVIVMMLLTNKTKAGVSVVVNGSFENDDRIIDPVTEWDTPERWSDVNLPEGKFGGAVWRDWSTDGEYNLTLYSYIYAPFDANDMATVSQQQVYLEDVNYIFFDLKLETYPSTQPWDPDKRSAVLLIDGEVVWDSNILGTGDIKGEHLNQVYTVDPNYKDENSRTLSLGIRVNVNEGMSFIQYWAQWDFVRFDTHCEGFGYLPGDINRDCYVDMDDLEMLAEQWLEEPPAYKYDLFEDDIVNFLDFAVIAENWMGDSFGYEQDDKLLVMDLNNDGIVNFLDFAILAKEWDGGNYDDISELVDEWLLKSWLYSLE